MDASSGNVLMAIWNGRYDEGMAPLNPLTIRCQWDVELKRYRAPVGNHTGTSTIVEVGRPSNQLYTGDTRGSGVASSAGLGSARITPQRTVMSTAFQRRRCQHPLEARRAEARQHSQRQSDEHGAAGGRT